LTETSETTLSQSKQQKATEKVQKMRKEKLTKKSDDDRTKGSLISSRMLELQD